MFFIKKNHSNDYLIRISLHLALIIRLIHAMPPPAWLTSVFNLYPDSGISPRVTARFATICFPFGAMLRIGMGLLNTKRPSLSPRNFTSKKTGGELTTQLFRFEDQGGRDITLRPELTASLARIVGANQREYPKPLKWFEIGTCFRYEKPQKGRGREFIQFNADIIGEGSAAADAELIALAIDTMLALGFQENDFVIRASDRESWLNFCNQHDISSPSEFLPIIDRLEKLKPEAIAEKLAEFHVTREQVDAFINDPTNASDDFRAIQSNLEARGLGRYFELDLTIVRGLAYYTGVVFEIFDTNKSMRAVAGGGRYDGLLSTLSNGAADLPATGFAMGDMVIRKLY